MKILFLLCIFSLSIVPADAWAGDLTVSGDDTVTIDTISNYNNVIVTDNAVLNVVGCTLMVDGNIEFDWMSTINFVNASLEILQDYGFQHFLEGSNWGTLRMTSSTVVPSGCQLHWYLNDEASMIVKSGSVIRYSEQGANIFAWNKSSISIDSSTVEEVVLSDSVTVTVSNSNFGFELAFCPGSHVELVNLRDCEGGGDWSISSGNGVGFSLTLTNSAWWCSLISVSCLF